jgi:hypothetical protein
MRAGDFPPPRTRARLDFPGGVHRIRRSDSDAGLAQLVERYLAKVQVDGSNPLARSISSLDRYAGLSGGHGADHGRPATPVTPENLECLTRGPGRAGNQ